MKLHDHETPRATLETEGMSPLIRHEVMEMHLFDESVVEEQALCGRGTTRTERMGVREYLEERLDGSPVGTVCQDCKALAMPLGGVTIGDMAKDLEDEGRLGDAEDCRELLKRIARETGLDWSRGQE